MELNINMGGSNSENVSPNRKLVFTTIFMVAGLLMAGYGFTQYQGQSEYISNAVNVTATVTDTNIRTDSSRRGGVDYQAEISFNYRYEGENYSSNFIYPLDDEREFSQESEAEKYLENYPIGSQVDAFVNPEEPGKGFLRARRSDQPVIFMGIGILMVLMGVYRTVKNSV